MESNDTNREDEQLRQLFSGFEPKLGSDMDFMTRLEQRLDSVEYIRRETATARSRSLTALLAGVISGFVAGILCSMAVPYIQEMLIGFFTSLPNIDAESSSVVTSWLAVGALTVLITLAAYDLTLAVIKPHDDR